MKVASSSYVLVCVHPEKRSDTKRLHPLIFPHGWGSDKVIVSKTIKEILHYINICT